MIIGEKIPLDESERWFVPALVRFPQMPRLGAKPDRVVPFCVDTGAINTALHPRDVARLQVPRSSGAQLDIAGIGGTRPYFEEEAELVFSDQRWLFDFVVGYKIMLHIDATATPLSKEDATLPSLLGMDILKDWCLDPSRPHLRCQPLKWDYRRRATEAWR